MLHSASATPPLPQEQVLRNSQALAQGLQQRGFSLVSGGGCHSNKIDHHDLPLQRHIQNSLFKQCFLLVNVFFWSVFSLHAAGTQDGASQGAVACVRDA